MRASKFFRRLGVISGENSQTHRTLTSDGLPVEFTGRQTPRRARCSDGAELRENAREGRRSPSALYPVTVAKKSPRTH